MGALKELHPELFLLINQKVNKLKRQVDIFELKSSEPKS
jgi:hypothetical protein